jgi:hypothetical protein
MSGLGQRLREILFGPAMPEPSFSDRKEWREAIHEHRNVSQVSVAEAKKSKKVSGEAIAVAEYAIKIMEAAKMKSDAKK